MKKFPYGLGSVGNQFLLAPVWVPSFVKLDDTEDYLSEKICRNKIGIRKKVVKKRNGWQFM